MRLSSSASESVGRVQRHPGLDPDTVDAEATHAHLAVQPLVQGFEHVGVLVLIHPVFERDRDLDHQPAAGLKSLARQVGRRDAREGSDSSHQSSISGGSLARLPAVVVQPPARCWSGPEGRYRAAMSRPGRRSSFGLPSPHSPPVVRAAPLGGAVMIPRLNPAGDRAWCSSVQRGQPG